jgi:hypothetical protein
MKEERTFGFGAAAADENDLKNLRSPLSEDMRVFNLIRYAIIVCGEIDRVVERVQLATPE